jgi:oligopeptide/dipeptide ABC transporter ATP-binding protein
MKTPQFSRRRVLGGIAAGALGSIALPGFAQSGAFPTKPIKIIMPWAAGGGGDVLVRAMVPSLSALPRGCRFADRCPQVHDRCRVAEPPLAPPVPGRSGEPGHRIRCWLHLEAA